MSNGKYWPYGPGIHFVFALLCSFITPIFAHSAQVTITWASNDPEPEGYHVYQRTVGQQCDYSQPIWTGPTSSSLIDHLDEHTGYYFVVRAFKGAMENDNSREVHVVLNSSSESDENESSETDESTAKDDSIDDPDSAADDDLNEEGDSPTTTKMAPTPATSAILQIISLLLLND